MAIHCFSGMGNSAAVAARLESKLPVEFADEVYVFPTYSWGLPPIIVEHLNNCDLHGRRIHLVVTCGDDVGNLDRQWLKLIRIRGGEPGSIYSVQMPNTYVCLPFMDVDPKELAADKLNRATGRVDYIAERLAAGIVETDIVRGAMPRFKSSVIYPLFFAGQATRGKKFHAADSCIGCGTCSRECPKSNIIMGPDRHPQWANDCTYCLRCYHVCPAHAVAYGRSTKHKGQYLHPEFQKLIKNFKKL